MKIRPNAKVVSFLASLMIRVLGVTWRIEMRETCAGDREDERCRAAG